MKELRANIGKYFDKLEERWRGLSVRKQHQYILCFFVGYLLLTVGLIGKIWYDTSKLRNDLVIEHIENPVTKRK